MSTAFVSVPLFHGISEAGLEGLGEVFELINTPKGATLFSAGEEADSLYLLVDGQVELREEGKNTIDLEPISLIGELGAMVGLKRRMTAITMSPATFLRASGEELRAFFERNASVAVTFYQNLLAMTADKVRRDERRIAGMRSNIIRTQHSLKEIRQIILDSPATPISEPIHDLVEEIIAQNRRANYVVVPPAALPAEVKSKDGGRYAVRQISRRFMDLPLAAAEVGSDWRGVLILPNAEIPVAGVAEAASSEGVRINLDMLIEEYEADFEAYLTQAQLLDVVL